MVFARFALNIGTSFGLPRDTAAYARCCSTDKDSCNDCQPHKDSCTLLFHSNSHYNSCTRLHAMKTFNYHDSSSHSADVHIGAAKLIVQ